ncbi:MAG: DUF432 domain-containing protein [Spirochaetes bacterium]|nr:DUF432 domain-containing protein [Spirochaetota bacterium]
MKLWEPSSLEHERDYCWCIGPLYLWIKRSADEWLLAFKQLTEDDLLEEVADTVADMMEKPKEIEWTRFILAGESSDVQLLPVLHDRAVVVDSETAVKILPGNRALFYVSIPVWIRVTVSGTKKKRITLTEIRTVNLSNTWFGDPMTGELGYSLTTRARRSLEESSPLSYRAICPVLVKNTASEPLDFKKLCIHVEHLRVYAGKERLWTNEVTITYTGADQPTLIDFSDSPPQREKDCLLLSEERIPVTRSLLKKSVGILKYFTSFE